MMKTISEGASALLRDTVEALRAANIAGFVVIGGWCPLLRNQSQLKHPGTLDVDLLFSGGSTEGTLRPVIEALKEAGFVMSAKHDFQLLREQLVGGHRFIYNVDLLHPAMNESNPGMFVDHLEFDVPIDDDERLLKKAKSIVLPNSKIIFDAGLFNRHTHAGVEFDLVDFNGMFLTKMDSCRNPKRRRDALDIFIGHESGAIDFRFLLNLHDPSGRIKKSLARFADYLNKYGGLFDDNVQAFVEYPGSPAQQISEDLNRKL